MRKDRLVVEDDRIVLLRRLNRLKGGSYSVILPRDQVRFWGDPELVVLDIKDDEVIIRPYRGGHDRS